LDRLTKRVNLLMSADPVLAPYLNSEQASLPKEIQEGRRMEKGTSAE
jgi:hypothetical protein